MKQISKTVADAYNESMAWRKLKPVEIVGLQLFQGNILMPFAVFRLNLDKAFERSIYNYQLSDTNGQLPQLQKEFMQKYPDLNFDELIAKVESSVTIS